MVMSSENELPPEPPARTQNESKIVYTRDFLLSLSSLDICKELPVGIDASILHELEDSSTASFDRQRSIGVSPLHSSKHSEYGSLSSNRLEGSTGIPRGNAGRWDTRSSGSSDKDGVLQYDRDAFTQGHNFSAESSCVQAGQYRTATFPKLPRNFSSGIQVDAGRRFGNQTRRPWQHPDHDGLLGSGVFPRPPGPGYAGTQAPKARGNGSYQLSRSTEPYQPPRPYKAGPYSRKENTDSINDETFGSAEISSDDRAEEESKRRASFELMRKDQQKALKEKQKVTNNGKEKVGADIFTVLGKSGYEKHITDESTKIDDSAAPLFLQSDSSRASFHIQPTASRPLVPPGFASAVSEKNICMQSSGTSLSSEGESALRENDQTRKVISNDQDGRDYSTSSKYAILQNDEVKSSSIQSEDVPGNLISVSAVKCPKHSVGPEKLSSRTFGFQGYNEIWEGDAVNDLPNEKEARSEMADDHNHSTSILEKLFGNALSNSSIFVENQDVKAEDETQSTALSESSKFAHWFVEEKKPVEDLSSGGLLSLITNNENTGSHTLVSSEKSSKISYLTLPSKNKDTVLDFLPSPVASVVAGRNEQYDASDKPDSGSGILTCEDLEQSILAEVKDSSSSLPHSMEGFWLDDKLEEQKADVNDHASKHLLSLLHKGTNLKEFPSSPMIRVGGSSDKLADLDTSGNDSLKFEDNSIIRNSETDHNSQKTGTLEALFGAAFMTELHSAEAPLSVKRGSGSEIINKDVMQPHSLPLAHANPSLFSSTSNEYQMNRNNYEENFAASKNTGEAKAHVTPGSCLRYRDSPNEGSKIGNVVFEVGATEIQLPEEDSLITVGDTLNPRIPGSSSLRNTNREELIPEKTVEILSDKLLNAFLRDGEHLNSSYLDSRPLVHGGSVDSNNIYNQLHGRLYPPHILPHQINQTRPLFPQLDHLMYHNSQMKLRLQDINNDPHHPFPAGVIPQQSFDIATGSRFDPAARHPALPNMLFPTNFPLHHPIQGVTGVPSHPVNHMPGYTPQMNNVHNFPLHSQQQHFDGFRIGMPGVGGGGGGGTHPGVLERLIEMEMRANSRQVHPAAAGHIHGTYGSDINANLRYR